MKRAVRTAFVAGLCSLLLFLPGCQNGDDTSPSGETGQAAENDENAENEDLEYAYQDIILDRSVVEGKMAVYFFRSDHALDHYTGGALTSGDATLLIAPDGTTMLIDCNLMPNTAHVIAYLQRLGIEKLDYFMMSHADMDHFSGYDALVRNMEIGHIYINNYTKYTQNDVNPVPRETEFLNAFIEKGVPYSVLKAGDTFMFGNVEAKVLWPKEDVVWDVEDPNGMDRNNGSIVVRFQYGESSFLFGGDAFLKAEAMMAEEYGELLQADVIKMNHHGTQISNGAAWIEATSPLIACAMHPNLRSEDVFNMYLINGAVPLHTAIDGTILVYTSGDGSYDVQVEKDRNAYFGDLGATDGHFRVEKGE